jgi:hypothetical protein
MFVKIQKIILSIYKNSFIPFDIIFAFLFLALIIDFIYKYLVR